MGQFRYLQKAPKQYPFVMGRLVKLRRDEEGYALLVKHPNGDQPIEFRADHELLESAYRSAKKVKDHRWFIVMGFVSSKRGKKPEFFSMGIHSVSSCGVPVESSYEARFFEAAHAGSRAVQRPLPNPDHIAWGTMVPDAVFIDTAKPTIVEVFGRSLSDAEYHVQREHKIRQYTALNGYGFWKWDAFQGSDMPDMPQKT